MLDKNIENLSSEEAKEDSQKKSKNEQNIVTEEISENKTVESVDMDLESETSQVTDNVNEKEEAKAEIIESKTDKEGRKDDKVADKNKVEVETEVIESDENVNGEKLKKKEKKIENSESETEIDQPEEDVIVSNDKNNNEGGIEKDETKEEKKADLKKDPKKIEIPIIDYEKLSLEDLVINFKNLLDQFAVQEIKTQLESIKSNFTKKFKEILAEKKREFIEEGGNEIDFYYNSPVKSEFNDLVFEYKRKRKQYYKDLETEQKENLEKRLELIEELKGLIDNAEASSMYKNFRVLQDKWRGIGQIPHTKYNDVWRTYHHHVERFYDLLHLNNDFRDLDFKHNLEEKTKLVERAEKLVEEKDINRAFKELQLLHRMWKEDIGPVARELREEIWSRFSESTMKIHQKRHEFQDKLDEKLNDNIDLKLAVIEKIKAINIDNITSHKSWQDNIKKLENLREDFFAAGRVPKSKNEEIWQLFKDATRVFNKAKNNFYKGIKKEQIKNLHKKLELVEQAENLKESEDWETATEVYKKIQFDWKNIGHVPSRDSDKIWKRFKNACNYYFDRLHEKQDGANKQQTEVFNKKKVFLEQFKEKLSQDNDSLTIEFVNEKIKEWRELGPVPVKMRHIDSKFNKILDMAYKKLNIDKEEAIFLKFKNIIDNCVEQKDERKIDSERLFVKRKVDEITKEIKQLENNISFISNASEDNPLVKSVYNNIDNHKRELEIWKKKISYLNQLEI
jgi:Domain of Unknown Function (DUF349)